MNTLVMVDNEIDLEEKPVEKQDLLQFLHEDNGAIAELFFQFSQAEEDDEKQELFEQIEMGLSVHSQLVEEILYPLVKDAAEEEDEEEVDELIATSEAGAYISAVLLDEIGDLKPSDEYFQAKMTILCELTKLQVKREEKEMFDKLRAADMDLDEAAEEALELKTSLEEAARNPVPARKMKSAPKGSNKKAPAKATSSRTKASSAKSSAKGRSSSAKSKAGSAKGSTAKSSNSRGKTASSKTSQSKKANTGASRSKAKPVAKKRSR
jgi:hypothetical protein